MTHDDLRNVEYSYFASVSREHCIVLGKIFDCTNFNSINIFFFGIFILSFDSLKAQRGIGINASYLRKLKVMLFFAVFVVENSIAGSGHDQQVQMIV